MKNISRIANSHDHSSAGRGAYAGRHQDSACDYGKKMSDHVAYALLVYTSLQIFVTVKALAQGFSSILPYLALVILVAAIIPACRWFEKRWAGVDGNSGDAGSDDAVAAAFKRDTIGLWMLAIGLPFILTMIAKTVFAGN